MQYTHNIFQSFIKCARYGDIWHDSEVYDAFLDMRGNEDVAFDGLDLCRFAHGDANFVAGLESFGECGEADEACCAGDLDVISGDLVEGKDNVRILILLPLWMLC